VRTSNQACSVLSCFMCADSVWKLSSYSVPQKFCCVLLTHVMPLCCYCERSVEVTYFPCLHCLPSMCMIMLSIYLAQPRNQIKSATNSASRPRLPLHALPLHPADAQLPEAGRGHPQVGSQSRGCAVLVTCAVFCCAVMCCGVLCCAVLLFCAVLLC
jgi:hypothetical protein